MYSVRRIAKSEMMRVGKKMKNLNLAQKNEKPQLSTANQPLSMSTKEALLKNHLLCTTIDPNATPYHIREAAEKSFTKNSCIFFFLNICINITPLDTISLLASSRAFVLADWKLLEILCTDSAFLIHTK